MIITADEVGVVGGDFLAAALAKSLLVARGEQAEAMPAAGEKGARAAFIAPAHGEGVESRLLAAVPLLKDRILDRENAFWLYQHFTYREDKAKVQEILEH